MLLQINYELKDVLTRLLFSCEDTTSNYRMFETRRNQGLPHGKGGSDKLKLTEWFALLSFHIDSLEHDMYTHLVNDNSAAVYKLLGSSIIK
jgi:hypothetical protein